VLERLSTPKEGQMVGHVVVCSVALTAGILLPLRAGAQAVKIYGPNPEARECFDSARTAVDSGGTTRYALKACSGALEGGKLKTRDKAATHVNRGILSMALTDYGKALEDFDAAMDLHPSYGAIYVNRGNVFFIREAYDDAIAEYTKALEAEMAEYQVAYLNRGMAHETLGHWEAAEADYRRALALVPDWGLAISKLARVLAKKN
jgi:tetratricopeptide (TPR) repeat protein